MQEAQGYQGLIQYTKILMLNCIQTVAVAPQASGYHIFCKDDAHSQSIMSAWLDLCRLMWWSTPWTLLMITKTDQKAFKNFLNLE
jgi:hypothetical protein